MGPISRKIVWIKITKCLSKPKKSEPGALLKIWMPENTMMLCSEEYSTKSYIAIKIS